MSIFRDSELVAHNVRIAVGQTMRLPWRASAMTESTKQRITTDVIILVVGLAILFVFALLGAL